MRYTWTIQGNADSYILLDISDIGEDSQYGYLRIYDGPTTFSPMFGNFCSSVPPGLMVSTGNSMFIVLKQHGPNTYKGFFGNYEIRGSNVYLNESQGNFTSPQYPLGSTDNMLYNWTILADIDSYIILHATRINGINGKLNVRHVKH
ncbi:exoskeleton protein RP43-like [Physella acuta]|uniref:exoskeleton protein RP43-like n=1 Tax=Physella acuta TaxID=109671 RepID=UPI0027DC4E44|nr:exoskeleton protein RP43-like [Physella acuta]